MAKKKTENIKAAPVLRAQSGGEQPTPTPEQTGTRTYQIIDPWKDRDVVNLVDVKAVDGEITEVMVNGEPAGGGGGGGSTAQVSFINKGNTPYKLPLPFIDESGYARGRNFTLFPGATSQATVFLGPDGCYTMFDEFPTTATATGDVRYEEGDVYITGDGTLTVA